LKCEHFGRVERFGEEVPWPAKRPFLARLARGGQDQDGEETSFSKSVEAVPSPGSQSREKHVKIEAG